MIFQYDKSKQLIGSYDTLPQAAAQTGIGVTKIMQNLQGVTKTVKGYVFSGNQL